MPLKNVKTLEHKKAFKTHDSQMLQLKYAPMRNVYPQTFVQIFYFFIVNFFEQKSKAMVGKKLIMVDLHSSTVMLNMKMKLEEKKTTTRNFNMDMIIRKSH